jgi:hypothetical protein
MLSEFIFRIKGAFSDFIKRKTHNTIIKKVLKKWRNFLRTTKLYKKRIQN